MSTDAHDVGFGAVSRVPGEERVPGSSRCWLQGGVPDGRRAASAGKQS